MIIAHLLDMDGVLVRGGQPISGSVDYVAGLVARVSPFRSSPTTHASRRKITPNV